MALSGAPPRLCVLSPRETLRPRSSPGWFLNARRDWSRCPNARGALVADALSLPLQRVRRYVKLDLAADAVPVINYKKLKREQDAPASAPRPAGATRDPMLEGGAAPPPNPRALAHMGGPQPGDGGGAGNHMAAVIRRIEAIYSAPRFDDSDEDDASRGAEDAPEPGDASASDDDDDFEDDGRDPNDPAVVAERAAKKAARAVKKAEQAKKRKTGNQPEEWYDVDDDFIDDEELDEYFERNGRKTKLGGRAPTDSTLTAESWSSRTTARAPPRWRRRHGDVQQPSKGARFATGASGPTWRWRRSSGALSDTEGDG